MALSWERSSFCINPPRTAISPSFRRNTAAISRTRISGTWLAAVSFGFGSLTKRLTRETLGRTFRMMEPLALMRGVTVITMPTGTVFTVVSKVLVATPWVVLVSSSISK